MEISEDKICFRVAYGLRPSATWRAPPLGERVAYPTRIGTILFLHNIPQPLINLIMSNLDSRVDNACRDL